MVKGVRHFPLLVTAVLGIVCGVLLAFALSPHAPTRLPATARARARAGKSSDLACAKESDIKRWHALIPIKADLPGGTCGTSRRAKFYRALAFMETLKTSLPKDWRGGADEALVDPLAYMRKMSKSIGVDFKQISEAYNQGGDIYLGRDFFTDEPADAVACLVHEARHSSTKDPGHVRCLQGRDPQQDEACDEELRVDAYAGAYAYQASFLYGVAAYNSGLSKADRKFFLESALYGVANDFNRLPSELGVPVDKVMVMDEAGELFSVDPFSGILTKAEMDVPRRKYTRIDAGHMTSSFFAYAGDRLYYSKDVFEAAPLVDFLFDNKLPAMGVRDARDLVYESEDGKFVTSIYLLGGNNRVYYLQREEKTRDFEIKPSSVRAPAGVQIQAMALASTDRYYLGKDGNGQLICYQDGENGMERAPFNVPGGWRGLAEALLHGYLYALDTDGRLKWWDGEKKRVADSIFKFPRPALRYHEGTSFRAALLEGNALQLLSWADETNRTVSLSHKRRLTDFAVLWRPVVSAAFLSQASNDIDGKLKEFMEACSAKGAFFNPWSGRPIGLDRDGSVIEFMPDKKCQKLNFQRFEIDNAGFSQITFESSAENADGTGMSQPRLRLVGDKGTFVVRPFQFVR